MGTNGKSSFRRTRANSGGHGGHRCPVKDESCPRFFGYEICGWALLPLGEGPNNPVLLDVQIPSHSLSESLNRTAVPRRAAPTTTDPGGYGEPSLQLRTCRGGPLWPPGSALATIYRLFAQLQRRHNALETGSDFFCHRFDVRPINERKQLRRISR